MELSIAGYFIECLHFSSCFIVGRLLRLLVALNFADFEHAVAVKITFFLYFKFK
jgi:hypothetical protein